MSKFVYRRVYNPDTNVISGTQPVSRGGTSATTASQALVNLGMIASNRLGVAGGAVKLDANSKVSATNLPTGYGSGTVVSIDGPAKLEPGATGVYTITDYDEKQNYDVSVSAGTVKREDEIITVVAPATSGQVVLTVGGQTFNIEVVSAAKTAPTISMGQYGTPVASTPGVEYTGRTLKHVAFALTAGSVTQNVNSTDLSVPMTNWKSIVMSSGSDTVTVSGKYVFTDNWESNIGIGSFTVDLSVLDTYLTGQEVYGVAGKDSIITAWTEGASGSSQFSIVVGLWNPRYNQTLGFHRQLVTSQLFSSDGSSDIGKISDYLVIQVSRCDSYVLVYNPYVNTGIGPANSIHMYYLEDNGAQIVPKLLWTYGMSSYNLGVPDYPARTGSDCIGSGICISGLAARNDGKFELRIYRNYHDGVDSGNIYASGIGHDTFLYDPAKGGKSTPQAYTREKTSSQSPWWANYANIPFYGRPHIECSPDGRLVYAWAGNKEGTARSHVVLALAYDASYDSLKVISQWSGPAWNTNEIFKDSFCKILNNSEYVRLTLNDRSGEAKLDETNVELYVVRFVGSSDVSRLKGLGTTTPKKAKYSIGPRNHTLMYLFKPSNLWRDSSLSSYYPLASTGVNEQDNPVPTRILKVKPFWKAWQERLYNNGAQYTDKTMYYPLADFRIPNTTYIRSGWDWTDHATFPQLSGKYMGGLQTYSYGDYNGDLGIVTAIVVRPENGIRRLGTLVRWFRSDSWAVQADAANVDIIDGSTGYITSGKGTWNYVN